MQSAKLIFKTHSNMVLKGRDGAALTELNDFLPSWKTGQCGGDIVG